MEPPRLEDDERFLNAALDHQRDPGVEHAPPLPAPRASGATADRLDDTSYLTTLLEEVDAKLDKLLSNHGPEDLPAPDGPVAVRVMMTAIRKEFDALHLDVQRLQRSVDWLTHSLATEDPRRPEK